MTRDPAEGINADGDITTGADAAHIPAPYLPMLQDCISSLLEVFGVQLHSLYIYGSVATGQAQPPYSDLDLFAIWSSSVDASEVMRIETRLSARYVSLVREVAVTSSKLDDVLAEDRDGRGWRCFVRHYCVCLAGADLRLSLPPCKPSRAVADALNDDVSALVQHWRTQLDGADAPAAAAVVAREAARKLLLVAATLESVEHGGWTTDRGTAAEMLAAHHPEWAETARLALAWSADRDSPAVKDVHRLLDLGDWLAARP